MGQPTRASSLETQDAGQIRRRRFDCHRARHADGLADWAASFIAEAVRRQAEHCVQRSSKRVPGRRAVFRRRASIVRSSLSDVPSASMTFANGIGEGAVPALLSSSDLVGALNCIPLKWNQSEPQLGLLPPPPKSDLSDFGHLKCRTWVNPSSGRGGRGRGDALVTSVHQSRFPNPPPHKGEGSAPNARHCSARPLERLFIERHTSPARILIGHRRSSCDRSGNRASVKPIESSFCSSSRQRSICRGDIANRLLTRAVD